MSECQKCGHTIDSRASFCDKCGHAPANHIESKQNFTSEIMIEENNIKSATPSLELRINTNQFYMAGYNGILDIQLQNMTDYDITVLKLNISGNLPGNDICADFSLKAYETKRRRFEIKPDFSGISLVHFQFQYQYQETFSASWGQAEIPIFEKSQDLQNISIQADKLIDIGSAGDNSKSMGNSIKVSIDSLIKQNRIHSANDLMMEYRNMPANFVNIPLEIGRHSGKSISPATRSIVFQREGNHTDSASLQIISDDISHNICLFSRAVITLGRGLKNNIITRLLPDNSNYENLSRHISSDSHCRLELNTEGLWLKDEKSANGTTIDGHKTRIFSIKPGSVHEISLAGTLYLESICIRNIEGLGQWEDYQSLTQQAMPAIWLMASSARLLSLAMHRKAEPEQTGVNEREDYILIYRLGLIGADKDCTMQFTNHGLESIHAGIVHLNNQFYLESFSRQKNVSINDTILSQGQLMALSYGDIIQIAKLKMKFSAIRQLHIHPD